MKNTKNLPYLALGLGLLAMLLRYALYAVAVDEKNLLVRGHPLELALYLLLAAAMLSVALGVKRLGGARDYAPNFGASNGAALGCLAFGAGILITVLAEGLSPLPLMRGQWVLGLAAGLSLLVAAWNRFRGGTPCFLLNVAVCLYEVLYLVSHYQDWSSNPQLQDYLFPLLTVVCLTLFAYEQAAFSLNMGSRRRLLAAGLLAAFGALGSLPHTRDGLMLLTGGVWCLTNLCRWEPAEALPAEAEMPPEDTAALSEDIEELLAEAKELREDTEEGEEL